jgi:hypothetical protein
LRDEVLNCGVAPAEQIESDENSRFYWAGPHPQCLAHIELIHPMHHCDMYMLRPGASKPVGAVGNTSARQIIGEIWNTEIYCSTIECALSSGLPVTLHIRSRRIWAFEGEASGAVRRWSATRLG